MRRRARNIAAKLLAMVVGLTVAGCRSAAPLAGVGDPAPAADNRVILSPGDVIDVRFFHTPELNETQVIRPDGKISMQLVGEVQAAGRGPQDLQAQLRELYKPRIEKPEVVVIVRQLSSRVVYVGGAVLSPGQFAMPGRLTALDAIMEAGGFRETSARKDSIVVIRYRDGNYAGRLLDLEDTMNGNVGKPYYLEPQDMVYVPRTSIVNVNDWVDQHINRIVPQFGLTIYQTSGNSRFGLDTSR